jgi:hypothetical protein
MPADLRGLADWLVAHEVEEIVMESTAQYWRPVWSPRTTMAATAPCATVRGAFRARSIWRKRNRIAGPVVAKTTCRMRNGWWKRLVAQELTLSFVPDADRRSGARWCGASTRSTVYSFTTG